jgi:MprA protease rhombosortase-interaction domain-containing protein
MLVLENDAEYKRWKIEQRNAIRVQRDRRSRAVVQEKLAQLRRSGDEGFEVNRAEKLVSTRNESAAPQAAPSTTSSAPTSPARQTQPSRGIDLDVGFPGGGGAIEPFTAMVALGTAGAAALARRRRKRNES